VCKKQSEPIETPSANTTTKPKAELSELTRSSAVEKTLGNESRAPIHPAEIYVTMSGVTGKSFVYSWLTNSNREGPKEKDNLGFSMEDGRQCTIWPTFIKHNQGFDVWNFELEYSSKQRNGKVHTTKESMSAMFDGDSSVLVFEDDHHAINIRSKRPISEHLN